MRWAVTVMLGAGLGLALLCGAGVASADPRADATSDGSVRSDAGVAARQRPAVVRTTSAVGHAVKATLPPMPVTGGRSFRVSTEAVTGAARDYVSAGGDPADAPRFFFGNLAVTSLDRLSAPDASAGQIRTDLGNLAVSGYFGGVWLRDSLRAEPPPETAPVSGLGLSAVGMGLFDVLAAGLTGVAASGNDVLATTVAHASVPVLLALYGYNRGYLEYLLENPPPGVLSRRETLDCKGFLSCSSTAFPLGLATRYDGVLTTLNEPTTVGWREMAAWSSALENVTGTGRAVWQAIAGQSGFAAASYNALVDLSSAYLMVSKAAVLSAMVAAADSDPDAAAASLRLQAGLWMWSGSYFSGLASDAPFGTLPSIEVG